MVLGVQKSVQICIQTISDPFFGPLKKARKVSANAIRHLLEPESHFALFSLLSFNSSRFIELQKNYLGQMENADQNCIAYRTIQCQYNDLITK